MREASVSPGRIMDPEVRLGAEHLFQHLQVVEENNYVDTSHFCCRKNNLRFS